ncbi:hypothetical protein JS562_12210 [Agrobacterium sp. S2]|nr:hypothetical protein [Agrobacterium sp. S2]
MQPIDLNELFDIESLKISEIVVKQKPSRLDPIADLKRAHVSVDYSPRFGKTKVPFMDFSKGDRNWIDLLITELTTFTSGDRADKIIMLGYASAKRGTGAQQTWEQYVDGLYADKVLARKDYSEAQLKHLPKLIDLLRQGTRLKGCCNFELYNLTNGKTL